MEMILQPRAPACAVSGASFAEGVRVASYLVRSANGEVIRYDVLEEHAPEFTTTGFIACRWVQIFKARAGQENSDRSLKLNAESLFLTLADPLTESSPENVRLIQFLALMLERKKLLRPKGQSPDGEKSLYEHAKTKQIYEVPAGELTNEFFIAVQEQLSVLVGSPKARPPAAAAPREPGAPTATPATVPAD